MSFTARTKIDHRNQQSNIKMIMTREKIKQELGDLLGHEVSDDLLEQCIVAYNNGRHGPALISGSAEFGYFTPFEAVLKHEFYKNHRGWPCAKAIALAMYFRRGNEKGDAIRECLFGTKEINYK
jgi:hypothetical protein